MTSHYDTYGPRWYDKSSGIHARKLDPYHLWVARVALEMRVKTLLDVGCGCGVLLDRLDKRIKAQGVDFSKTAVASCIGLGHEVNVAYAEELPIKDGSFECVTCLEVLEHTEDVGVVWNEIRRVASKVVIVTVPPLMASAAHKWVEPMEWWQDRLGVREPNFYDGMHVGWIIEK